MPEFACTHCAQQILADDSLAGTVVTCPECQKVVMVPRTSQPARPHTGHATPASRPPAQAQPPRSTKGKKPKRDRTTLIALGITALAMVLVFTNLDLAHRMVFGDREEVAADFEAISREMRNSAAFRGEGTFDVGAPATTKAGRLRALILGFSNEMIGIRQQYVKERESSGLPAAFAALGPHFKSASPPDTDLMLTKTTEAAKNAKQRAVNLLKSFPQRVKDSDLDSSRKRVLLRILEESDYERISAVEQMLQLELSHLEQARLVCDYIHSSRGSWAVQGNKLVFAREADAAAVNGFLSKMAAIRNKQLAAIQQQPGVFQ
jgi:hypothetical protein